MAAAATAALADAPSQVAASRPDADDAADGGITIDLRGSSAALCRWSIPNFSKLKQRTVWSRFFDVGGYDCRLLVYPSGDSQALPGYISIYLQISDPRGGSGGKWDCFASYRLAVVNQVDDTKSLPRDSWHRFSAKKKSHGWCDFIPASAVLEPKQGFIVNDVVIVTAEILILQESVSFSREIDHLGSSSGVAPASQASTVINGAVSVSGEVFSGKFTWRVHNFSLFRETIKTQKIMSPLFPAGECSLRLSVYQSPVGGVEHLSMCLESKDTDKGAAPLLIMGAGTSNERSCWCLFRMSVTSQVPGGKSIHRDSYGRFAADARSGDNTSLGWNDYMPLASFVDEAAGYIVDDTAVFSTTFHIIRESCSFNRLLDKHARGLGRPSKGKPALGSGEPFQGKFTWRIDNFTRLKDLLKKRKITGLCIKSKRFQVGGRDCRLIVYPRGQSQPPNHLSMFLEVTDSRTMAGDWSCFVSHRLAVVNQRADERSVSKESQNRYSKAAKDWGWREFVTLTSLFDLDAGFLVNDTVVFSAEVLVLKESTEVREVGADGAGPSSLGLPEGTTTGPPKNTPPRPPPLLPPAGGAPASTAVEPFKRVQFTWRIENFPAFRDILETRKIFSRYFSAGGVDLRIGVYESFDTLCIYLESSDSVAASSNKDNAAAGGGSTATEATDRNFWVKYRIAVLNQKHPESTEWKESAICTKTWNNSVLQFIKVSSMLDHEAGYLAKDTLVLACEVLDCCPWCEFGELDVYATDDGASLSTDAEEDDDEDDDSDLDALQMFEDGDIVRTLLLRAGLSSSELENPVASLGEVAALQEALRDKLVTNPGAAGAFLMGLRLVLTDILKAKQLLAPMPCLVNGEPSSTSLLSVLGGIHALQPAVVDMALDFMVAHCKVHRHQCSTAGRRSEGEGSTSPTTPAASSPQRAAKGASGVSGSSQPSSRSSTPVVEGSLPTEPDPAPRPTTPQPEEVSQGPWSPPRPPASSAASDGDASECSTSSTADVATAAAAAWQQETVEVLSQMVRWLRSLEPAATMPRGDVGGGHSLPTVQKVAALLNDAPLTLQADVILLVPTLVAPSEHTAVAGALLGRLAEASREGAAVEAALRLPVLAALGKLAIDPAVAEKVLRAAVEALPYLSDTELPPAVGLVLKLSSASSACRAAAVKAVRQRVKQAPTGGEGVRQGTVDALRLAVMQHAAVASAMLGEMDGECRGSKSPTASASDVEMLLDVLGGGDAALADEAARVAERLVVKGALTVDALESAIVSRRALAARGADDAHGLAAPLLQSNDHSAVMRLTGQLSQSTHAKAVAFAAPLYGMLFRLGDGAARETTLQAVIQRAFQGCMMPQPAPAQAKGSASSSKKGGKKASDAVPTTANSSQAHAAVLAREYAELATRLVQEHTSLGPVALQAALDAAQRCGRQALDAARQLRDADAARAAALTELQQRLTQTEADRDAALAQCRQLAADAEARAAEFRAELATQATSRRELQERLGQLEGQAEWVRGEHQEAAAAWAREKRELAQKVKDAELMLSRLKTQKRDEGKRAVKERSSLTEKVSAVEAQAAAATQEADAAKEALRAAQAAHDAAAARADKAEAAAAAAEARAAQLQALAAQQAEQVLQLQSMSLSSPRVALAGLSPRELESTTAELERTLAQARGLQGQRARGEDFATSRQGLSSAASMPPGAPLGSLGLTGHTAPLGTESMGSMSSLSRLDPSTAALGTGSLGGFGGLFYGSGGGAFVTHPKQQQGQPALGGGLGGLGGLGSMQGYGNGLLGGGLLQQQPPPSGSTGSAGNASPAPSGSGQQQQQQLW